MNINIFAKLLKQIY